jgi:hypothetical protein
MLSFAPLPWAELVFHVLAHVRSTASLAPSVYDDRYVALVRQYAGGSEERTLGEDAALLGRLLADHGTLARVQLLAWLFDTVEQARSCAHIDLSQLQAAQVGAPQLLAALAGVGVGAEILRCAAHLEEPAWELLPPIAVDAVGVAIAFADAERAAPMLRHCNVGFVRALRLRGRVLGRSLWVGAPGEALCLACDHVAWQAAHEATVCEVVEQCGGSVEHDRTERVAVVLLGERACDAGLRGAHAAWFAHLAQPRPPTARGSLSEHDASLLRRCRDHLG